MRPNKLSIILRFLTLTITVVFLAACNKKDELTQFPDTPSKQFPDTLHSSKNLEVLLTDLTGGFYLGNATGSPAKGVYGYNRLERRYVSGWTVHDGSDRQLNADLEYTLVQPDRIERLYSTGLRERIEAPFNQTGLLISLKYGWGKNLTFRPNFDFRELSGEKFPEYETITETGNKDAPFVVGLTNRQGGYIALAVSKAYDFLHLENDVREAYQASDEIGRPFNAMIHSVGDISVRSFGSVSFAIGWGETPESAIFTANTILKHRNQWRAERKKWIDNLLSAIDIRADNQKFAKSYAWARLHLAGMIYKSGEEQFLLTALPYFPLPDGMFTALAAPGIAELNQDNKTSLELLRSLIAYQNTDSSRWTYGMFPGKIHSDKVEYNQPLVSGMIAQSYVSVAREFPDSSDDFKTALIPALLKDERGTGKFRMKNNLLISGATDHFLYDSPAAPERPGKTVESTYLYGAMHSMIYNSDELWDVAPDLAELHDSLQNRSFTQYSLSGAATFLRPLIERIKLQHYVDQTDYNISADLDTATGMYQSNFAFQTRENNDYIPTESIESARPGKPMEPNPTVRFLKPFFSCLFQNNYGNAYQPALRYANSTSLLSPVGLRSLAPSDEDFQRQHNYHSSLCSYGTTMSGDALVWTAGCLADMYCHNNFTNDFLQLYENLSDRCLNSGIFGALPEAENAEHLAGIDNTVWSAAHSVSLAEFVRVTNQRLLGLSEEEERQYRFKPMIPDDWGNYRIETSVLGGRIWLERYTGDTWQIGQEGIEPDIRIILDISPAYGEKALHNVRVYPGERICVTFKKVSARNWQAEQRLWSAREQSVKLWGLPGR